MRSSEDLGARVKPRPVRGFRSPVEGANPDMPVTVARPSPALALVLVTLGLAPGAWHVRAGETDRPPRETSVNRAAPQTFQVDRRATVPTMRRPSGRTYPVPFTLADSGQEIGDLTSWKVILADADDDGDLDGDSDLDVLCANVGDSAPQPNKVWLNTPARRSQSSK